MSHFRISAMRLSNLWEKFRLAAACAFGAYVLAFLARQVYSAVIDGAVMCGPCAGTEWITFQARPIMYVVSLVIYLAPGALLLLVFFAWLFPRRDRWRSRQLVDDAIRQTLQER
jgi:hypothetical protein